MPAGAGVGPLWEGYSRHPLSYPRRCSVIFLSFSPKARKPSPWGLQFLARGRPAVFYGDEDSDRLAAEAAGVGFVLVGGVSKDERQTC
jgi:phosphoglycolate phosphatase-like HAD superfamily hydrolase